MDAETYAALQRATHLLELGRPQAAKQLLLGQVGADALPSRGWCLVAQCDLALDDPAAALSATDQAIHAEPDNEWAYRVRSIALRQQNDLWAALEAARESVRLKPDGWQSHVVEAGALVALRTARGDALASANRAVDCAPNEAEAHFVRGLALASLDRGADARAAYEQALALDPQHSNARNNLGVLALRSHKLGSAADHFVSAVAVDPSNQLAARNIAAVGQNLVRLVARRVTFVMLGAIFALSSTLDAERQSTWVRVVCAMTLLVVVLGCVVMLRRLPSGAATVISRDVGARVVLAGLVLSQLAVVATFVRADDLPFGMLLLSGAVLVLLITIMVANWAWKRRRGR